MKRVLVLSPHPDDEAIGCGGAILRHVGAGDRVHVVFLTSGERGGHGRPAAETLRIREREAERAGRILEVPQREYWRLPDGALRATGAAVARLRQALVAFRPDRIYVTHGGEMHPDHRGALRLLARALEDGIGRQPEVLLYEVWTPLARFDEVVDISDVMEQKLRAVRAHRSQCAVVGFPEAVRGLNRYRGELHSWPGGDYAEVFARWRR